MSMPKLETQKQIAGYTTGTREEWLAARLELLKAEKELTRRSDELARRRQELPWVRVDKEYRFETDEGTASLTDLFRGRSQLLVYHFMFGPDYTAGCPSCSAIADGFNGFAVHLANHDVTLSAVSRAPLAKLQAYKQRLGWTFPWASSLSSDFNYDFNVSLTEEQQRKGDIEYNYERSGHAMDLADPPEIVVRLGAICGTDAAAYTRERPGMSAFTLEDGSSITPTPLMHADWTASGACTSGSTVPLEAATKRTSGGAATMSTASSSRATSQRSTSTAR